MAKQVTIRRGTTAEHSTFTGAEGEITVDTTKDTVVVHDGGTQGGFPLALESAALSDAEIKTAYENNANTNEFSDAEQSKLAGIGTIATQDSDAVSITGGSVIGITDLTIADGGTGASDAPTARSNLGSTSVGDAVFVATDEEVARAALLVPNKNVIINGNFDIWQRGTSFPTPTTGFYDADRWRVDYNGTVNTFTISQETFTLGQTDVPGEPEFFRRWDHTVAPTGQSFQNTVQFIEDVRTFAGETITLSFYAKADAERTVTTIFSQHFGFGGTPSGDVNSAGLGHNLTISWTRFEHTITLPGISDKTIGSNNNDNLRLIFLLPLNTTMTIDIAQVQLEKGSVATEFEHRSIATELAMAQRYYEKSYDLDTAPGTVDALGAEAFRSHGTNHLQPVRFKTRKRRHPTMIAYNPSTGSSGTWRDNNAGEDRTITFAIIGETGIRVSLSSSVDLNVTSGHWTADAEL